ncbi:hypothetical protein GALMADRAFT_1325619, partial [Galerina marginata CBS 339.88]
MQLREIFQAKNPYAVRLLPGFEDSAAPRTGTCRVTLFLTKLTRHFVRRWRKFSETSMMLILFIVISRGVTFVERQEVMYSWWIWRGVDVLMTHL